MNRLERVETGRREFEGKDLEQVIGLLADRVRETFPEPDEHHTKDTYYSLRPEVKEWLANTDKKKLARLDGLLDDYGAAQQIGKFIKLFVYALAGIIGTTYTVVKAAPDILSWLRGVIK